MMYLKNTSEEINIVGANYLDKIPVMYNGKKYPVIAQFKVEDLYETWTDWVTPDGITSDPAKEKENE